MSKYLLKISPIALFLMSFADGNSQTFDYFENDPEWRVSHINFTGIQPGELNTSAKEIIYYLEGDSLINDTTYLKLYERGEVTFNGSNPVEFDLLTGLIRQENKRVYQRVNSEDLLLYDFDLQVGDLFPDLVDRYYNNTSFPETVESIDSIFINGNYHKMFYGLANEPLIEGVGHLQGMFFNEPMFLPFDFSYSLHCYRQLGEVEYVADEWLECNFNVSVAEWQVEHSLSVYPNPTSDKIFIESSSSSIQSVQVYSQAGKLVYSDSEIRQQSIEVDLTYLESGLYFVQIIDASGVITQKLVKE